MFCVFSCPSCQSRLPFFTSSASSCALCSANTCVYIFNPSTIDKLDPHSFDCLRHDSRRRLPPSTRHTLLDTLSFRSPVVAIPLKRTRPYVPATASASFLSAGTIGAEIRPLSAVRSYEPPFDYSGNQDLIAHTALACNFRLIPHDSNNNPSIKWTGWCPP